MSEWIADYAGAAFMLAISLPRPESRFEFLSALGIVLFWPAFVVWAMWPCK